MPKGPRSASWPAANQIRTAQVTTGSVAAGAEASITATWAVPMESADYTVVATILEATAGLSIRVLHVISQSATQVVVRVINNAADAKTGTLHVLAVGGSA